jgi:hypothetical protein
MGNVNCCDSIMLDGRNESAFRPSAGLVRKPAPQCLVPARHQINPAVQDDLVKKNDSTLSKDLHGENHKDLVQNVRVDAKSQKVHDKLGQTRENGNRRVDVPSDFLTKNSSWRKRENMQDSAMAKVMDAKFRNSLSMQSINSNGKQKFYNSPPSFFTAPM